MMLNSTADNNESHSSQSPSHTAVGEEKYNDGADDRGAFGDQNGNADADTENVKRVVAQHTFTVTLHTNIHSLRSRSLFLF